MTVLDDLRWDPYDVQIDLDPYDVWRRMRDEAPVYRNDKLDFFALSRYDDVQAASRNIGAFSSARGTVLEMMGSDMSGAEMMIFMDPPGHDLLRALVSRAFTPRRISELAEPIRDICAEYLDSQVGSGGFDYLADFGTHLPSRVISSLLGVSTADRPYVLGLINTMFHIDAEQGMLNDIAIGATLELSGWLGEQLTRRRGSDLDDMLTVIANTDLTHDGVTRKLTDNEASAFGVLLATAGTETVARLLGWSAVVLGAYPDQRAELAADFSLIPNAIEEMLRFEAPSPVQGRMLQTDVEMHGVTMPKDAKVLLLTGSAGRDERTFPQPDRFDIHRRFEQHVSFGVGAHYCLGAALARLEGRIAWEETLKRFPTWEVDHERVERLHTSTVRGHKRVPIVVP